ncbi:MAG TPA: hypothetical protein VGB14_14565 [Acidimicrobiales bacterium]|jgi:hypothetical protein
MDRVVRAAHSLVATTGGDVDRALAVLTAVTEAYRGAAASSMPAGERAVWERTGARFDEAAPMADAARRVEAFARLVARSVDDAGAAGRLGVDRTRLSQRLRERSLLSFRAPDGERRFPEWQFDVPTAALREVLSALDPAAHPLTVDHWAHAPQPDLEVGDAKVSPAEWLATGGDPAVVAALAAAL